LWFYNAVANKGLSAILHLLSLTAICVENGNQYQIAA